MAKQIDDLSTGLTDQDIQVLMEHATKHQDLKAISMCSRARQGSVVARRACVLALEWLRTQ